MDDVAEFEIRLQRRVRAFAASGIRPVDSSAVAHAVVGSRVGGFATGSAERGLRRPFARRIASVVLVAAASILVLAVVLPPLLSGRLGPGASPAPPSSPTLAPSPTTSATEALARPGVAYWLESVGIYVADLDRPDAVRIFDDASAPRCGNASSVTVSPDGRFIAYRTGIYGPGITNFEQCPNLLHVIDAAGRPVASFPGWGESAIAWSPDSSLLATWLDFGGDDPNKIAVYGVDGIRHALLDAPLRSGEYDVAWSPDGAPSIFNRGAPGVEIPIDGSAPQNYEDPPAWSGEAWSTLSVTYSPDGERVAVITDTSLMITTRDGTTVHELTDNPYVGDTWSPSGERYVGNVVWSPTGAYVAYEHLGELQLADVNTGNVTTLPITGPIGRVFGFSTDGEWILVNVGRPQSEQGDLWAVSADGSGTRKIAEGVDTAGWILATDPE